MLRDYTNLPRPVHVLCLSLLVNRAGSFVLVFLTIYVSEQLQFGEVFAAQCMGVFGLGSILASLVGGHLADQIGRRIVMLTALFGGAVLLILLSLMESRAGVLLTVATFGLVAESFRPACSAMLGDLTLPSQRASAFSLMYIAINLGFALGPPIGGILADISYKLLFWGDAATMGVCGFIILAFIPETRAVVPPDGTTTTKADDISAADAARRILADPPFLLFCLATLLIAIVFMQSFSTLPLYIRSAGYTNQQFGLLMAINGLMIFICQLPLTHSLSRFNPMSNILAGGILIAVGFGLYWLPPHVALLCVAIVIWTTGEMMQAPFKQAVVTNLAPPQLRARYMGMFSVSYSLALTIGAPVGGAVLARFGPRVLWAGCLGVSLTAIGIYVGLFQPVSRRNRQAEAAEVP